MPGPESTDAVAGRAVFTGLGALTTEDADSLTLPVLGTSIGAWCAIIQTFTLRVEPMGADWALLDRLRCGASWAEVAWWALKATLSFEVERVFLTCFFVANMALFTRCAPVHVEVGARLTVLGRHASSFGAGRLFRADGGGIAGNGYRGSCRAIEFFWAFCRLNLSFTLTFAIPAWWAKLGISRASWADVAWRAWFCVSPACTGSADIALRAERAVIDAVRLVRATDEHLLERD